MNVTTFPTKILNTNKVCLEKFISVPPMLIMPMFKYKYCNDDWLNAVDGMVFLCIMIVICCFVG